MILQNELIDVDVVDLQVLPLISSPSREIYSFAGETESHSLTQPRVRPVSCRSIVRGQPRMVHVRIGRIHRLRDWEMAELLDDRNQVIVVLPLKEAHDAVTSDGRR
jgi:hypothetical protein